MLAKLKLAAYVVLVIFAAWFGWSFYVNYSAVSISGADDGALDARVAAATGGAPQGNKGDAPAVDSDGGTNAPVTNAVAAAGDSETNTVAPPTDSDTNATLTADSANSTNPPAKATKVSASKKKGSKTANLIKAKEVKKATTAETRHTMMRSLGGLLAAFICLGILFAYDVSRYMAGRSVDMLFDDDGTSNKDPEYERAEQVWAEGHPMEAIEMMRNYLKKNPREQYVALRIAEIYEKDFKNYLAAAMEYEEVLKKKLPPENWGWAAIHLCNLYSKLERQKEYEALLNRIVTEYGQTSAARKARKRLGLPEESDDVPAAPSARAKPMQDTTLTDADVTPAPAPSNLPPGFRPKK